jgi:hypothetical protein
MPIMIQPQKKLGGQNIINSTFDMLKSVISITKQVIASTKKITILSHTCLRPIAIEAFRLDQKINRPTEKAAKIIHGKYKKNRVKLVSNETILISFILT